MQKYLSQGARRVQQILGALERSGARIISEPDPTSAPYEITVGSPDGEVLDLVCYAFTAKKYGQKGRPEDEHRFQVKYGSDFGTRDEPKYHEVWLDPEGRKITLFFGVGNRRGQGHLRGLRSGYAQPDAVQSFGRVQGASRRDRARVRLARVGARPVGGPTAEADDARGQG